MCHIDLSNRVWSLRLPVRYIDCFRILVDSGELSFHCLVGWKYSPILCQKVMEHLVARAGLVGVVGMVYLDDVLVVGRGKLNSRKQTESLVLHLHYEGPVVSVKSTLEPTRRLVWLGKVVDFDSGARVRLGWRNSFFSES